MPTPQARHNRRRLERGGVAVAVVLDPALEPDAVQRWNDLRTRLGGQKPALLWLLRNAPEHQP